MPKVTDWLSLLMGEVGRGVYVWGGNGQLLDAMASPEEWIAKHETSDRNAARAIALYRMRKDAGIRNLRAFDCSGLVYWSLKSLGLLEKDLSAHGLYGRCKPIADEKELTAGDLLFRHDGTRAVHVGVYAEDGRVIECRGRDVGVVCEKRRDGEWNRMGRLTGIRWTEDEKEAEKAQYVTIRGKSVRARSGGGTAFRTVRIVHAGDRFPLLGRAQSGWYRIDLGTSEAYVTDKPRYTEVTQDA